MTDVNCNSLENLKAWLAGRKTSDAEEKAVVSAPNGLRSMGFPDLILEKAGLEHQETVIDAFDFSTQKLKYWTELNHLVTWSNDFISALKNNKDSLAMLELIRSVDECPISLARYHVDESVSVVESATNFELGLDLTHPDTRGHNYAVNNILIENSNCLQDIIRQIFACLYTKCAVRLIVKTNCFYSAVLVAYLVDLMHACGASTSEINCFAFDPRESIGNERFSKAIMPNKSVRLSVVATVFSTTDTFAAAQGILDSYFREQYPNLIVLVEESAYDRFVKDWQRYYSNVIHIGPRVDERTTVVDSFNEKVQIDLAAIDIKASHKMAGNAINVLKFRNMNELFSLLGNFRKVPLMSIWNDDVILSRLFCLRLNQCNNFWINHMPRGTSGYNLAEDMVNIYNETVVDDMAHVYNMVYSQYSDEAEQLRKISVNFLKKDDRLRTTLIIQAYFSIIAKCKSLKMGTTMGESVARLKRFQRGCSQRLQLLEESKSMIHTLFRPVGLAIFLVREESAIKNKAILVEFIFKNLLLGNAVLLVCPANTLGQKFSFENDHVIPFKMVHEPLPDISRLSLDNTTNEAASFDSSMAKKRCPKNTYAIEILPDMTGEASSSLTVALGSRRKSIWISHDEQVNYWADE